MLRFPTIKSVLEELLEFKPRKFSEAYEKSDKDINQYMYNIVIDNTSENTQEKTETLYCNNGCFYTYVFIICWFRAAFLPLFLDTNMKDLIRTNLNDLYRSKPTNFENHQHCAAYFMILFLNFLENPKKDRFKIIKYNYSQLSINTIGCYENPENPKNKNFKNIYFDHIILYMMFLLNKIDNRHFPYTRITPGFGRKTMLNIHKYFIPRILNVSNNILLLKDNSKLIVELQSCQDDNSKGCIPLKKYSKIHPETSNPPDYLVIDYGDIIYNIFNKNKLALYIKYSDKYYALSHFFMQDYKSRDKFNILRGHFMPVHRCGYEFYSVEKDENQEYYINGSIDVVGDLLLGKDAPDIQTDITKIMKFKYHRAQRVAVYHPSPLRFNPEELKNLELLVESYQNKEYTKTLAYLTYFLKSFIFQYNNHTYHKLWNTYNENKNEHQWYIGTVDITKNYIATHVNFVLGQPIEIQTTLSTKVFNKDTFNNLAAAWLLWDPFKAPGPPCTSIKIIKNKNIKIIARNPRIVIQLIHIFNKLGITMQI